MPQIDSIAKTLTLDHFSDMCRYLIKLNLTVKQAAESFEKSEILMTQILSFFSGTLNFQSSLNFYTCT